MKLTWYDCAIEIFFYNDPCKTDLLALEAVSSPWLQDSPHLCLLVWEKFRISREHHSPGLLLPRPSSTAGFLDYPVFAMVFSTPSYSLWPQSSGSQGPSGSTSFFRWGITRTCTVGDHFPCSGHQSCVKCNLKNPPLFDSLFHNVAFSNQFFTTLYFYHFFFFFHLQSGLDILPSSISS